MNDHHRGSGTGPGLSPSPTRSLFLLDSRSADECQRAEREARQGAPPRLSRGGCPLKLATWNVNSIRARTERVIPWLEANQPDVLCMQELKVEEEKFPFDAL